MKVPNKESTFTLSDEQLKALENVAGARSLAERWRQMRIPFTSETIALSICTWAWDQLDHQLRDEEEYDSLLLGQIIEAVVPVRKQQAVEEAIRRQLNVGVFAPPFD